MIRLTECPEAGRWRDLLDGMLPERETTSLTRHLDDCPHCQSRLEALAADGAVPGDVRQLGSWRREASPALQRAMAELTQGLAQAEIDTRPETPSDEPILDFLRATDRPDSLGRFGPYEVLEVLGHGGMGVVLRVLDPGLNREAAIKVLAPQLAASGTARKRFAREARSAAAVCHENVVAIHAVDVAQGLPYLVMEYVAGESLEQRLRRSGPLELEDILNIALQTARGLAAAHERGVIHRDVKPGNILLAGPVAKLTDFGLARAIDDGTVTQSGFLPGTPAYMAPEQASGESADHRADLFSLGSVLYAICTGRPPFSASTLFALLRRVSEEEPIPVQTLNPSIPDWLVEIMKKLHAKKPDSRFQNATEVVAVLEQCLDHVRQPARTSLPWSLQRLQQPPRRTRRRGLVAILLLMLGLLGVGLWAAGTLRIKTPQGTLVIEVSDPKVNVTVDGSDVVISGDGIAELRLRAGQYKVEASKDGKPVLTTLVEIKKDGKEVVRVSLEPTAIPRAAAPLTLSGHQGVIRALTFSPDGKLLVSGGGDQAVRLWDAGTGKQLRICKPLGPILAISFFPDGKVLLTVGADGTLQLWDVATGKMLSSLKLPGTIKLSAVESSGKLLASAMDNTVRVWDMALGKERLSLELKKDEAALRGLALSPDGHKLAVARADGVMLWEVQAGKLILRLPQTNYKVHSLAFSPDGQRLLVLGDNVRLWDTRTGQLVPHGLRAHRSTAMVQSPDGRLVAIGDATGLVAVTRVATGEAIFSHQEKTGPITILAFSPDGRQLAWATPAGEVRLSGIVAAAEPKVQQLRLQIEVLKRSLEQLRLEQDQSRSEAERQRNLAEMERARAQLQEKMAQAAAAQARDSEMLARQSLEQSRRALYAHQLAQAQKAWNEGELKVLAGLLEDSSLPLRQWEWHYLKKLAGGTSPSQTWQGHAAGIRAVTISPDGQRIASGSEDASLRIWDAAAGKVIVLASPHNEGIESLSFSPDGKRLASAGRDGKLVVLDTSTARELLKIASDKQGPACVAHAPDGKHLAWVSPAGKLSMLDAASGKVILEVDERKGRLLSVAFSPDAKSLAAAGEDASLQLIDVTTGGKVRMMIGDIKDQRGLAFRPDGKVLVAAGTTSGIVSAWDVASGKLLYTIQCPKGETCLAFSPDGQRLVTGGADNKVKVWDAANGQALLTLTGHAKPVLCIAFSPDGNSIVSGSQDKTLRVWPGVTAPR